MHMLNELHGTVDAYMLLFASLVLSASE